MRLERLRLTDFRNYRTADVRFSGGPTLLVGPNAQGKTNLLEAVHYLATGGSHRVPSDAPLVREGAATALVLADVRGDDGRRTSVGVELRPGGTNRAAVNGQQQARASAAVGVVRSVLFAPEDVLLVRGEPAERRRFLDQLLAQRRPLYAQMRLDHEKVVRQRNALLRAARTGRVPSPGVLEAWTDALVRGAAPLLAARLAVVHALAGPIVDAYADLVAASPAHDVGRAPSLRYVLSTGRSVDADPAAGVPDPAALADELRAAVAEREQEELRRGTTLVGPHRDDLELRIGPLPAKGFASHGEQWSLVLALRLASREVLATSGDEPVILLDDVFAELDVARRGRLAARCARFEQVLVTAAVADDVPLSAPSVRIAGGTALQGLGDAPAGGAAS